MHAENPEGSVIILADEDAKTGLLIEVMDQARLAGVSSVSIAAERE
jgi:biopolymer transport protein ExbD